MQLSSRLLLGALALLSAAPSVKAQTMILTSDQQLTTLANDPDKKFDACATLSTRQKSATATT